MKLRIAPGLYKKLKKEPLSLSKNHIFITQVIFWYNI
jgi:hypothetical protein